MLIHEVCQLCGLTRKAVNYYEEQGLIAPRVLENGYRDYGEQEIATLREIALLRRCGLSIREISTVLDSRDKATALTRIRQQHEIDLQRAEGRQARIAALIEDYNVESYSRSWEQDDVEAGLTIREKILNAFPGSYGIFLSLHFGRFLEEPIRTEEQRAAYDQIIAYLDHAALAIPVEWNELLNDDLYGLGQPQDLEQLEREVSSVAEQVFSDTEQFLSDPRIQHYLEYRSSEAYLQSPAHQYLSLWRQFQQNSGYVEVFLANLQILSPSYRIYQQQLNELNDKLLGERPPRTEQ